MALRMRYSKRRRVRGGVSVVTRGSRTPNHRSHGHTPCTPFLCPSTQAQARDSVWTLGLIDDSLLSHRSAWQGEMCAVGIRDTTATCCF